MFSVIFEVHPKSEQWDAYLGYAKLLRPELERIDGFIDNIRYRSLTREGWVLSLSSWRDEKALVRWRTQSVHHQVQEKGRTEVFHDYHLRVGELTADSSLPADDRLPEQRFDATEVGESRIVTMVDGRLAAEQVKETGAGGVAGLLGLDRAAPGLVDWDVFDAVLTPGDAILLLSWKSDADASVYEAGRANKGDLRIRRVRVIRDYGMRDRWEAPQFYPDVGHGS